MVIYIAQAFSLGVLLWCATPSSRRTDLFIGLYVFLWTIGVIFLYWKFGNAQDVFYSDDQKIQVQMIQRIAKNGIEYSFDGVVGNRYVVTIPAYLLTQCGINMLLALKFLQAIFLVLTYCLVLNHFVHANLRFKTWYVVLFSGPIFIFMSLLGLRDLALAYFSLYTIIGPNSRIRAVSWLAVFLLRPHLAIALVFGRLIGIAYRHARLNLHLLLLPILVIFSFMCGTYSYVVGAHFQSGTALDFASLYHLITQDSFIRFFANFGGLQFLLFGPDVVKYSILNLLLLRLIFIDTFLIPSLFVWIVITSSKLRMRSVSIYSGFGFFLGLVAHTDFNSSRQNIPFLVLMGVTVAEHFALRQRDHNKHEKSLVATLSSSRSFTHM